MSERLSPLGVLARALLGAPSARRGTSAAVASGVVGPVAPASLGTAVARRGGAASARGPGALCVSSSRATTLVLVVDRSGCHVGGHLSDQCHHLGRSRRHTHGGHGNRRFFQQVREVFFLRGQTQRDDITLGPRPSGSSRAVQVCLVFHGWVNVNDQVDVIDVDSTGSNIGGNKDGD